MEAPNIIQNQVERDLECIWMQAGVVNKRNCGLDYNCLECKYDRIMKYVAHDNFEKRRKGKPVSGNRGKIMLWKDKLRAMPVSKRPCIHHMKRRIEFRTCTNEYRCGSCDFDQYFNDQYSVHAIVNQVNALEVKGFKVPQGYYFHKGHTWMKVQEGSTVRVGMDDFALRLLGPLDRIESPLMGKEVQQDRGDIAAIRGDNRAKLLSPVSGVVTAINNNVREQGSLANQNPYSGGWIMQVRTNDLRSDLKNLMINKETSDYMDSQVEQLYRVIEETAGPMATDGGLLGDDIFGSLPELGWERLNKMFLNNKG